MPLPSKNDFKLLRQLRDMILEAKGDVRVERGQLYVKGRKAPVRLPPPPTPGGVRVVPTSYAGGAGKYIGKLAVGTGSAIDPDTDLEDAELGTAGDGGEVLLLASAETEESTGGAAEGHGLTLNKPYLAVATGDRDTEGRPVYQTDAAETCPEEGE